MARFMQNAAGDFYTQKVFDIDSDNNWFATYVISELAADSLFEMGLNIGDEIPTATLSALISSNEIYPSGSSPFSTEESMAQRRANHAVASFFKHLDDEGGFTSLSNGELFRRDVIPELVRTPNGAMRHQIFLDVASRLHDQLGASSGWRKREIIDLADDLKRYAPATVQRTLEKLFPPDMTI